MPHQSSESRIHYPNQSIEVDTSSKKNFNCGSFGNNFGIDMEIFSKLSNMFSLGEDFAHMLYTYRSVSRPIPTNMNISEIPSTVMEQQEYEIFERNDDNNERVMDVLRPEISKLKDLMIFTGCLVLNFKIAVECIISSDMNGNSIPEEILRVLVHAFTMLITLDYLKDVKTCFRTDFQRYKQTINVRSDKYSLLENSDFMEEISRMQIFLSHADPRKAQHFILSTLEDEIRTIPGHERVLTDLIIYSLRCVEESIYMTPREENMFLLSIPYLMILLDGIVDDHRTINIFQYSELDVDRIKVILLRHPVIPVFHEVCVNVLNVLERSSNFDRISMSNDWGGKLPDSTLSFYNISTQWLQIKEEYVTFTPKLITLLHDLKNFKFLKSVDSLTIRRAKMVYDVTKQGLKYLCAWNNAISRAVAWKYSHPAPVEHLQELGADFTLPYFEYEKVAKYNFTKAEFSIIADIVGMIKSLAGMIDEAKADILPSIRLYIHHEIQQMVQGTLMPILHRMDKRKSDKFREVFRLRQLIADWIGEEEPIQDYKAYSRKMGSISAKHPARVVCADYLQLQFMRWNIWNLSHEHQSNSKGGSSFFGTKIDIEIGDINICEKFFKESFFYPYLIDLSCTLRNVCDLSYLWYREIYLENTRCAQFPVDISIPYLLAERTLSSRLEVTSHVIHNDYSLPLIECLLHVLDIYNDAARYSLYFSKQQHLYDEIEAELNLVFDHIIMTITTDMYSHFKNLAAYTKLEENFKHHLSMYGSLAMDINKRLYDIPSSQRLLHLLGRTVDLNFIMKQQLNNIVSHDIELAFMKLDSSGITGISEFSTVIGVIEETHHRLSEHFFLDSFSSLFKDHNETYEPKASRGFFNFFLVKNVTENLLPNFNYNIFTGRFLKSHIVIKPFEQSTRHVAHKNDHFGFGTICREAYRVCNDLTYAQFSGDQVRALSRVAGTYVDIPYVFDECITFCWNSMIDLLDGFAVLKNNIPIMTNMANASFGDTSFDVFFSIHRQVQELLLMRDLKSRLFQAFKEIGNAFAFMHLLNQIWTISDLNNCMAGISLLAACPNTYMTSLDLHDDAVETSNVDYNCLLRSTPFSESMNNIVVHTDDNFHFSMDMATIQNIPELSFRSVNSISKSTKGVHLLHVFVHSLGSCLSEMHFKEEFGNIFGKRILKDDLGSYFHNQWSMLNFIYLSDHVSANTPADIIDPETHLQVKNEDEFGHGFSIAGCLFMHLLDQKDRFELFDYNRLIKKMHEFEGRMPQINFEVDDSGDEGCKKVDNTSLVAAKGYYMRNLKIDAMVQSFVFNLLNSCCPNVNFNVGALSSSNSERNTYDAFV